jgi:hypothetical protein
MRGKKPVAWVQDALGIALFVVTALVAFGGEYL